VSAARRRPLHRPAPARGLSRRDFLVRSGLVGVSAMGLPALLAACSEPSGGTPDEESSTFDNWPEYIDGDTVSAYQDDTGFKMNYLEGFNDNNEYFARIVPSLSRGKRIVADILAPTFWLAGRLIALDWVQKLPLDLVPNKANLRDDLVNPTWDPTGEYTLPYQTGMTGLAYNVSATGRELGSIMDLFDPEFNGRIGMLTEMRDTVGLVMLGMGIDPSTVSTYAEAEPVFEKLEQAKSDGQIRAFTGNDYLDDLATGNFACCVGWSGDVLQLTKDNPDVRFVVPEEGGMRWADTMVWVAGSNRRDAVARWMDYLYDPANAARVTYEVQYISPVKGVQDALLAMGEEDAALLAEDPLLFPDAETQDRLRSFANLPGEEEELYDEKFSEITGA
jgi:spermidine/putrescine transport system substrate-binding protein